MQRLSCVLVAALIAAVFAAPARAHDLPYEVVVYVRPDAAQLQVLVRVPLALLGDARLPTRNGGYLDLTAAGPALAVVAAELGRNLDLMADGRPLAPPIATFAVSKHADAAFDRYESAAARFGEPPLAIDTPVDPNFASIDVRLESPAAPAAGRLSIRVNGFRARTRGVRMIVHDLRDDRPRIFTTTGAPRRIDLEPDVRTVAPIFARLGLEQFALGSEHLLFLLCLAIPPRRSRQALLAFGAFAAGYLFAMLASALIPGAPAGPAVLAVQALVAGALVIVALQNVTEPRLVWIQVMAIVFGLLDGAGFGFVYRQGLPLAGSHTLTSLVSFVGPVLLASVWLLIIARPLVGLLYRSRVPERWAILCLSAIPIHAGLHGLMQFAAP